MMATTKIKLTNRKLLTPKGQFQWAYLSKPDDAFNKSQYRCTIYFLDKKDTEYVAFVGHMKRLAKEYAKELGKPIKSINIPMKVATESQAEKAGVPVGTPFIEAKTQAMTKEGQSKGPVAIFNAKGQKDMSLQVFSGDLGRLEITIDGYDSAPPIGRGLTIYLQAAQLLKSSGKGSAGGMFEQEDDFLTDDADDSPVNEADPDEFEDEDEEDEDDCILVDGDEEEDSDEEDDDPTSGLL